MHKNKKYIWALLLGIFIFHGILEDCFPTLKIFDECIALLCFPLALIDFWKTKDDTVNRLAKSKRMELAFLVAFLLCGFTGNLIYRFQPLWVVLASAVLSAKFFMILISAGFIQKDLQVKLEEQEFAVEILSVIWFGYYILSLIFPKVLVQPAAWDVCAKASILFALLIFCNHKRVWLYRISLLLMITMLVLSGKEKAYGAMLVFVILYYAIVHKKVQTKIRYILYMAVPVALLAWDKIYCHYIQVQNKYPKSIMTNVSLQIAKDYFPIGTGFGTFGSTYATIHYSPVYYLYGIAENKVLSEESKLYLTDVFWPILFGETGVLGTVIYCALILILFIQIQRVFYYNKKKYMLLIFMFVYMLITTFSEAGFMQPMIMVFAFVMGTLLEEYEEKRDYKMRYFNKKD